MSQTYNRRSRRNKKRTSIKSTIVGLLIAGTLLTGAKIAAKTVTINVEKTLDYTIENTIGYDDIGVHYNFNVHPNNFVILPVSREIKDITALREKLEKCNEKDISVGLELLCKANNPLDLYLDYEFIQAITQEYDIDLPIYLNIDSIIENKDLNNEQKQELISNYQSMSEDSNTYYGYSGKDSNLFNCNRYICNLTNNECYLHQETNEIKYPGKHTITKTLDGYIKSGANIARFVNEQNNLIVPSIYLVQPNETLKDIALKFGISENDILKYNKIKDIEPFMSIKIPNLYQVINLNTKEVTYSYAVARGVDIDNNQDNIDWNKLSETSDYVIIKLARDPKNYSSTKGTYLTNAINQIYEANNHKMAFGLYFSVEEDMKISVYSQRFETYLTQLDNQLQTYSINVDKSNIPIFINFENYFENNNYYELLSSVETIAKYHGYNNVGIYCNGYLLDRIITELHDLEGNKKDINETNWLVWRAGGNYYIGNEESNKYDITLNELQEPKRETDKSYDIQIQQVTNVCTDTGAGNYLGHTNVSYLYDTSVFGNSLEYKTYALSDDESLIEINLNKYPNIPINKIIYIISNILSGMYCILGLTIVGSIIYFKVESKKKDNPDTYKKR